MLLSPLLVSFPYEQAWVSGNSMDLFVSSVSLIIVKHGRYTTYNGNVSPYIHLLKDTATPSIDLVTRFTFNLHLYYLQPANHSITAYWDISSLTLDIMESTISGFAVQTTKSKWCLISSHLSILSSFGRYLWKWCLKPSCPVKIGTWKLTWTHFTSWELIITTT